MKVKCRARAQCEGKQAVTFTHPTKDRLNLIFVCTLCNLHWRKEEPDQNDQEILN